MIQIVSNGETFDGFTKISVNDAVDNLCSVFVLECTSSDKVVFPIKKGSSIDVMVEGIKVMTGIVEKTSGGYTNDSYSIKLEGRDITKEILKTDLDPSMVFKGPIQLEAVMQKTIDKTGLDLEIVNLTGGLDDFTDKELITDDVGSSVWDLWIALAEKRQVLISKNSDGNVVIMNPNTEMYETILKQSLIDKENTNNILKAEWSLDDSERRYEYNVHSQANISVQRKEPKPGSDEDYWTPEKYDAARTTVDPELQNAAEIASLESQRDVSKPNSEVYRQLTKQIRGLRNGEEPKTYVKKRVQVTGTTIDLAIEGSSVSHETAENPSDQDECDRLANWKCNKERVKSVSYSCTVQSLLVDDVPWQAGYLITVKDEIADIDALMMIESVSYSSEVSESGDAEETAQLTLTIPDGYTPDAVASDSQKQVNFIGDKWTGGDFQ